MLYLMKVYRQQEIQDGGLKKGNALSLTVILEVTYCIHQISSHRNIIPTTMSNVHVCAVSESIAIDIYATQPQKKPGNSYHNRQAGRLFYLGSHSHYTVYFNDNFDVCWKVPGIVHTITVCLHRWDINGLSWQISIPRLHSIQARPVWPQHLVNVWRQFNFCVTCRYTLERKVSRQNSSKEQGL